MKTFTLKQVPGMPEKPNNYTQKMCDCNQCNDTRVRRECHDAFTSLPMALDVEKMEKIIFNDHLAIAAALMGMNRTEYKNVCTRIATALSDAGPEILRVVKS